MKASGYAKTMAMAAAAMLTFAACEKNQQNVPQTEAPAKAAAAASDPAFDARWQQLAGTGIEALYIEDDKGDGLMGNVRRASDLRPDPAADQLAAIADQALPERPQGEDIQRTIRRNLAAVKTCYMSMSRAGAPRSGKAIVSFGIGPQGETKDVKIDAPNFAGTALPDCVTGRVARWSFPKSKQGGGELSFPFVFVGG